MIAGREGHASAALGDQIARLGLDDRVRLLGHRPDVAEVLSAADLFVFPSVYEGLGGALIEALALGLPIVASDLPALREVVRPGENADLVSPTDSAALAAAVVALLDDPARRQAYGARSRQLFEDGFDADRAADDVVTLLAGSPGRRAERSVGPRRRVRCTARGVAVGTVRVFVGRGQSVLDAAHRGFDAFLAVGPLLVLLLARARIRSS